MPQVFVDQDNTVLAYPASLRDLRQANPNVSFPEEPPAELCSSYGLHEVIEAAPPECDPFSQDIVETDPLLQDGSWHQAWEVVDLDPAQQVRRCDYQAFWDALIASPSYQVIRQQATTDLNVNTCCTEFIAAMTDAKAGRPNRDALQACIWLLMAALTLTPEEQAALQELLDVGSMSRIYSLAPAQ